MTIDSGWVKIIKKARPEAFTERLPAGVRPDVVFIDGQIKLMKAEFVKTWAQYLEFQFERVVKDAFSTGARVVVLAFDNYKHVPTAKAPTQRRRTAAVAALDFDSTDDLPPVPPHEWASAMRNRVFKSKVIALVVRNMRHRFAEVRGSLVIDWHGVPEVAGAPLALSPLLLDSDARRGECDIKAFAYAYLGTLLIYSTDGDFIPLSLLHMERAVRAEGGEGAAFPHKIFIHRMATRVEGAGKCARGKPAGRSYEYVNVAQLLDFLNQELKHCPSPALAFATLVAATGCDFTMNLPQLGPTKIWRERARLGPAFVLDGAKSALLAVLTVYFHAFQRQHTLPASHFRCTTSTSDDASMVESYGRLVASIHANHTVSARIKDALWDAPRCLAHARNVAWTILYWSLLEQHPDPLSGPFGFQQTKKGCVIFEAVG